MSQPSEPFWTAFHKAQQAIKDPTKDAVNPHFRSRYADLKAHFDAARPALHANGLVVSQTPILKEGVWVLTTTIAHVSGGMLTGDVPILSKEPNNPQAFGSGMSYARRYGFAALLGIASADEDDDGEAAAPKTAPARQEKPSPKVAGAEPFAAVEEAVAHLATVHRISDLDAWAARVKASKFAGTDEAACREAYKTKREELR